MNIRNNLQKQYYIEYFRRYSFMKLFNISKMQRHTEEKSIQKTLRRIFFGEIKLAQDNVQHICWSMKQAFENRSGRSVQMSLSC